MQRYQPPHIRRQAVQGSAAADDHARHTASPEGRGPSTIRNNVSTSQLGSERGKYSPTPSRKDWSAGPQTSTSAQGNILASPTGDIRPMRPGAGGKVQIGEMELMQSVSRSGGDGAEGDALKDWLTQERYRRYIDERIDVHYSTFATARHVPPRSDAVEEIESLGSIVLLFRKLREGVIASHRIDNFAIEVFESSARFSVLAQNRPQLLSALSGLVPGLYIACDIKGKGKASVSTVEDLADRLDQVGITANRNRKEEFASLLLLYHLVTSGPRAFHGLLVELTAPKRKRLRLAFSTTSTKAREAAPFMSPASLRFPLKAYRAVSDESFNPITFFALVYRSEGTTYERTILSWVETKVRDRAWEAMRKTYMSTSQEWAGYLLGLTDQPSKKADGGMAALRLWVEAKGVNLEDGRIQLR